MVISNDLNVANASILQGDVSMNSNVDINGTLTMSNGIIFNHVLKTTNYSVLSSDYFVEIDTSDGAITVTLPDSSTLPKGQVFIIVNESGGNTVTVTAPINEPTITQIELNETVSYYNTGTLFRAF